VDGSEITVKGQILLCTSGEQRFKAVIIKIEKEGRAQKGSNQRHLYGSKHSKHLR
jgi:hypothetical protein